MTELIEYVLPIFAASNWLFFYYVTGEQGPVTCVIGVAISCLNFILPMQKINESIFQIEDAQPLKETYEQALFKFDTDYARENPATSEAAREDYLKKVNALKKKKGKL